MLNRKTRKKKEKVILLTWRKEVVHMKMEYKKFSYLLICCGLT